MSKAIEPSIMTENNNIDWGDEDLDGRAVEDSPIQQRHVMETDQWIYRIAILGIVFFQ